MYKYDKEKNKMGFDIDKTYTVKWSKEELIGYIKRFVDTEFNVILLPRTEDNADMIIRSRAEEFE